MSQPPNEVPAPVPATLALIPAEVLSIVVNHVLRGDDRQSVLRLSMVDHAMNDSLIDWTYDTVILTVKRGARAERSWTIFCGSIRAQAVRHLVLNVPPSRQLAATRNAMITQLRAVAPNLVSIAYYDYEEDVARLTLTARYSPYGRDFRGMGESMGGLVWGTGLGRETWNNDGGRVIVKVELDGAEHRWGNAPPRLFLARYNFFSVTLVPSTLAPPANFPIQLLQQFAETLRTRAHDDQARPYLRMERWGQWQVDGGEGALEVLRALGAIRVNVVVRYAQPPHSITPSLAQGRALAIRAMPIYNLATIDMNEDEGVPSFQIRVLTGNRYLLVSVVRLANHTTGAAVKRQALMGEPTREIVRFAEME